MQDNLFLSEKELNDELKTLKNSLKKYKQMNDIFGEANQLYKIGDILIKLHLFKEAIENLSSAIQIHEKFNEIVAISRDYALMGKAFHFIKEYDKAINYYQNAIDKIEKNNLQGQILEYINYYGEIGKIKAETGDYDQALTFFNKTIDLHKKYEDIILSDEFMRFQRVGKIGMADNYWNIGDMYKLKGDINKALEHYNRALEIYNELDVVEDKADILQKIGDIYCSMEEYEKAYSVLKEAGSIHHDIKDIKNFAIDLEKICEIICYNYPDETLNLLEQCVNIYDQLNNYLKKAEIFRKIGLIYGNMKKMEQALEFHNKALDIYQELNHREGIAKELRSIGELISELDNIEDALGYYNKSLKLFIELENKIEIAGTYMNIAALYNSQGDEKKAIENIDKAIELVKEVNETNLLNEFKKFKDKVLS
ncbi:MAG: tetratricopeptide repeat protein [Candidatus Helarchaeota archaeon]